MKITSYKELQEELKIFKEKVEAEITLESVKAKNPKRKNHGKYFLLENEYSKDIPLEKLKEWIKQAEEANAEILCIDPNMDYDNDFEYHEISFVGMVDETEEEYEKRVDYQLQQDKRSAIAQKEYELRNSLEQYQKYLSLKSQYES